MLKNSVNLQKTVAIIDCNFDIQLDPNKKDYGGSETWILELAKEFVNQNWHVVIFANVNGIQLTNGIEYYPYNLLQYRSKYQIFDIAIFSRGLICSDIITAKKNYIMFHDLWLPKGISKNDAKNLQYIDNIYVLSDYSKNWIINNIPYIPTDRFKLTHNGIDYTLYEKKYQKSNSMVWSSCKERGLNFFITYVLPLIIQQIPDFTLHICSYNNYEYNINDSLKNNIKFHGKLSKIELAELQCKSKIWCYPNLGYIDSPYKMKFAETFCITAVENIAADNIIIAGDFGGLQTTLKNYPLVGADFYENEEIAPEKYIEYGKYLANYCIKALNGELKIEYNKNDYIYTWENAVKSFIF